MFLYFTDLLLLFQISDIGLTENLDSTGTRFEIWIRKKKAREVYILQAPSAEIKTAWVNELSNLLWKQARRNRGTDVNHVTVDPELNCYASCL
jgi:hypothetical protein